MIPKLPRIPNHDVKKISKEWIGELVACIKYAMTHPQGDGKTTYESGGAIHAIRQSGNALGDAAGDTYKGYFKVIKTAANKIKIVDGFDTTDYYAGKVNVNYSPKSVSAIEFTITANSFIYLECTSSYAKIIQSPTELESVSGTFRALISRVTFADSTITDFSRENVALNILMAGACS